MLSSDRLEAPGRRRRRKARRNAAMPTRDAGTAASRIDASEPWPKEAAEALTRLYESDEGQLHKPRIGERAHPTALPIGPAAAGQPTADDRAWLETHLSDLAERLQASLARHDPEASLAALTRRLEAIEERFGRALERVAQRADVHGLRAIEAHVLELAEHLEKTRDRLEQIGTVEEEVRGLGQRLDAADQQQIGALGKLLRDYIGEWRESEQRTTGALHSLEEAVSRLGDTVDTMEASKPAPDLSFATLAVPDPARARTASDPLAPAGLAAKPYHSTLDAADYAPKPLPEEPPAGEYAAAAGRRGLPALPGAAVAWSTPPADDASAGGPEAGEPESRASRIMAVRAKLRQARMVPAEATEAEGLTPPDAGQAAPEPAPGTRSRSNLLLLAGIALLAGGVYLLAHALTAAPPRTIPARTDPGVQPSGVKPDLADPTPRPAGTGGAAG
jgi:hypothetical protein